MYKTYNANLPTRIKQWLNSRGLTDQTIASAFIGWNGNAITIPIFDGNGDFLFFKFRKDPAITDTSVPKYRYERGHKAALYGLHFGLGSGYKRIICEGEFDCMILHQHNFPALTSTGGAGTFLDEWLELILGKEVYICFDNDEAGHLAAIKMLNKIPTAKLIVLPAEIVGDHGDITDYFNKAGREAFDKLMDTAETWPKFAQTETLADMIASQQRLEPNQTNLIQSNHQLTRILADIEWQKRENDIRINYAPPNQKWIYEGLAKSFKDNEQAVLREIKNNKLKFKRISAEQAPPEPPSERLTDKDIEDAKAVPIENFYLGKFKKAGRTLTGVCPFHSEKTGSFCVYPKDNSFHCFGCDAHGDVIEFVMKQQKLNFRQAVKFITN